MRKTKQTKVKRPQVYLHAARAAQVREIATADHGRSLSAMVDILLEEALAGRATRVAALASINAAAAVDLAKGD